MILRRGFDLVSVMSRSVAYYTSLKGPFCRLLYVFKLLKSELCVVNLGIKDEDLWINLIPLRYPVIVISCREDPQI